MDIANLAIVFGPELLRSPTETQARLIQNAINLGWANGVIRMMLEEYDSLLEVRTTLLAWGVCLSVAWLVRVEWLVFFFAAMGLPATWH
jgi:hypothetical protein